MVRRLWSDVINGLVRDRALDLAAQMAFWALLSIFPFVTFILTILGFLPLKGVHAHAMTMVTQMVPQEAARFVDHTIMEVIGRQRGALLVLSLLGGIWSASRAASSTMYVLNCAYEVRESRSYWERKLRAIGLTFGAATLGLVATVALLLGPEVLNVFTSLFGFGEHRFTPFWRMVRWPVLIGALWMLSAATFDLLPNVRRGFRLIGPGIVVGVVGWLAVSLGINFFVTHIHSYARTYGTLAGAVVLMLWLYFCALCLIIGGEVDATLGKIMAERE